MQTGLTHGVQIPCVPLVVDEVSEDLSNIFLDFFGLGVGKGSLRTNTSKTSMQERETKGPAANATSAAAPVYIATFDRYLTNEKAHHPSQHRKQEFCFMELCMNMDNVRRGKRSCWRRVAQNFVT